MNHLVAPIRRTLAAAFLAATVLGGAPCWGDCCSNPSGPSTSPAGCCSRSPATFDADDESARISLKARGCRCRVEVRPALAGEGFDAERIPRHAAHVCFGRETSQVGPPTISATGPRVKVWDRAAIPARAMLCVWRA